MTVSLQAAPRENDQAPQESSPTGMPGNLKQLYEERNRLNNLLYGVTDTKKGVPFTPQESQLIDELQGKRSLVMNLLAQFDFRGL